MSQPKCFNILVGQEKGHKRVIIDDNDDNIDRGITDNDL